MAVMIGQCRCHNSNPSNFWRLVNPYGQNEFWGICCKRRSCNSEYLIKRFTNNAAESDVTVDGIPLYFKSPSEYETDPDFQADTNRERIITGVNFTSVQRGDHVGFRRKLIIWHHAIVEKVTKVSLDVISWGGGGCSKARIRRDCLSGSGLDGMWKFKYSSDEEEENPADLVIARAKSRLPRNQAGFVRLFVINDSSENYGLLNQNCETFSTYCKRGCTHIQITMLSVSGRVTASCQLPWLCSKIKEMLAAKICHTGGGRVIPHVMKAIASKCAAQLSAETVENLLQFLTKNAGYFELIGLGVVAVTEIYSFLKLKRKIDRRRQLNRANEDALNQELQTKGIECLLTVVLYGGVGTALFFASCPLWLETILSVFLLVVCKTFLPRLISYFIEWFSNNCPSMPNISHFLRQPMVA